MHDCNVVSAAHSSGARILFDGSERRGTNERVAGREGRQSSGGLVKLILDLLDHLSVIIVFIPRLVSACQLLAVRFNSHNRTLKLRYLRQCLWRSVDLVLLFGNENVVDWERRLCQLLNWS